MRRDVRRFVYFRWRLLEAPNQVPVNLVRVFKDIHGFLPPFGFGAVSCTHYLVPGGGRGVRIERPDRLTIAEPIRARLFAAIASKHQVEVRFATSGETPSLKPPDRLPRACDRERVEEWPPGHLPGQPIVAELALGQGVYLTDQVHDLAGDLDCAVTFADLEDAERHLALLKPRPAVVLRYVAAARAEADLREAQLVDGKPI